MEATVRSPQDVRPCTVTLPTGDGPHQSGVVSVSEVEARKAPDARNDWDEV